MNFAFFFSKQLRHPRGWLGTKLASVMNRENAGINRLTLAEMQIEAGHHVMEIGFGGAALLEQIVTCAAQGAVAGVEMSETLLKKARLNPSLRFAILRAGTIESLPFADASFDRVCTVNTIYFWSDQTQAMREVLRVLKPGGRFTIGFHTEADLRKTGVSESVFRFHDAEAVESLFSAHGFVSISRTNGRNAGREFICISGHRNPTIP